MWTRVFPRDRLLRLSRAIALQPPGASVANAGAMLLSDVVFLMRGLGIAISWIIAWPVAVFDGDGQRGGWSRLEAVIFAVSSRGITVEKTSCDATVRVDEPTVVTLVEQATAMEHRTVLSIQAFATAVRQTAMELQRSLQTVPSGRPALLHRTRRMSRAACCER
jgi:hypothetical protein